MRWFCASCRNTFFCHQGCGENQVLLNLLAYIKLHATINIIQLSRVIDIGSVVKGRKRTKTCQVLDCQIMVGVDVRTDKLLSKPWFENSLTIISNILLSLFIGSRRNEARCEINWWDSHAYNVRDTLAKRKCIIINGTVSDKHK